MTIIIIIFIIIFIMMTVVLVALVVLVERVVDVHLVVLLRGGPPNVTSLGPGGPDTGRLRLITLDYV